MRGIETGSPALMVSLGGCMPNPVGRTQLECPVCGLTLTIVGNGEAPAAEYDIGDWSRLCRHADRGSPLVCPNLEPLINDRRRRE